MDWQLISTFTYLLIFEQTHQTSFDPIISCNGFHLCAADIPSNSVTIEDLVGFALTAPAAVVCAYYCMAISSAGNMNCSGFNDVENVSNAQCQFYARPPTNFIYSADCNYFQRDDNGSRPTNPLMPFGDARDVCSFPFTYQGQLNYRCVANASCGNDIGCYMPGYRWISCTPRSYGDFDEVRRWNECNAVSIASSQINHCPMRVLEGFSVRTIKKNVTILSRGTNNVTLMSIFEWSIVLSRVNSDFPVNLTWETYEVGFGHIDSNFWLGLKYIHQLTNSTVNGGLTYKLRVEVQENSTNKWYSQEYAFFYLDGADNMYALRTSNTSTGDAGDGINAPISDYTDRSERNINGRKFLASDRNNGRNCPGDFGGGWWFRESGICSANRLLGGTTSLGFRWTPTMPLQQCRMMLKLVD